MPITPGGRWSPADSDDWDLTTDLAAMQVSNEAATATEILKRQSYRTGTESDRTSIASADLFNGLEFYATNTRIPWIYDQNVWKWRPRNIARLELAANQNISTTNPVAITGLTTTLVVPAAGRARMTFTSVTYSGSTSDLVEFRFRDGTTAIQRLRVAANSSPTQAATQSGNTLVCDVDLAAGTHVLNMSGQISIGGAITLASSATERTTFSVDWLG